MTTKIAFIDLETTGLFPNKHGIIQIAVIIDIDGEEVDRLSIKVRPFPEDAIVPQALTVNRTTEEELSGPDYLEPKQAFEIFTTFLKEYVNPYDKTDKFHFSGYNSQTFDDPFLRSFFKKCEDKYYSAWFYTPTLDVMILSGWRLRTIRDKVTNFKLATVADLLGILVDPEKTHEAMYDIELTREIYYKLGLQNASIT